MEAESYGGGCNQTEKAWGKVGSQRRPGLSLEKLGYLSKPQGLDGWRASVPSLLGG